VGQLATPGWPLRGEPPVAPPAQQQSLGPQRLVEQHLGRLFATPVADTADPAADAKALVTCRVLDDSVERDVLADHDPSHLGPPRHWTVTSFERGTRVRAWATPNRPPLTLLCLPRRAPRSAARAPWPDRCASSPQRSLTWNRGRSPRPRSPRRRGWPAPPTLDASSAPAGL